ncbi:hypothetical protein EVAR_96611_1 [Eumeta japonica]|uniref:Uncharacterized protein n=1 Tax=Eumeta variegata TaxID=151549 RepID=A0A4C1WSI7_EUMVA|nr:hypothetical protein EVAR_96611_1 [Eumeta japonica]
MRVLPTPPEVRTQAPAVNHHASTRPRVFSNRTRGFRGLGIRIGCGMRLGGVVTTGLAGGGRRRRAADYRAAGRGPAAAAFKRAAGRRRSWCV